MKECGYLKNDFNRLNKEFKNILIQWNEEYIDQIKNQEKAVIERFLDKLMEQYFAVMFEDVRHERSLNLPLSLRDPDIMRGSKFTDHEIDIMRKLALEKLHRHRILKEQVAMSFLESRLK